MDAPNSSPLHDIVERARGEIELLTSEIGEIDLLVQQARAEAGRNEQKRAELAERLRQTGSSEAGGADLRQLTDQLLGLTRRAAIMEAQVDVLEGKLAVLTRFRESLRRYGLDLEQALPTVSPLPPEADRPRPAGDGSERASAGLSRVVLTAQEDLRREIARAMHDGPAQSLTNIVLQVQIVERLLTRDPVAAKAELDALVAMVQETLEATKGFIFDVRPMVLDDLGLVPTLRRVARDRGRRSQIPIEFESFGQDRRLPMDVETSLFRIIEGAVTAYLGCRPDRLAIRLDWSDDIEARIAVHRDSRSGAASGESTPPTEPTGPNGDVPAALAAMIEEQRASAARAAKQRESLALPANAWREIEQRAEMLGFIAELRDDGREVRLILPTGH